MMSLEAIKRINECAQVAHNYGFKNPTAMAIRGEQTCLKLFHLMRHQKNGLAGRCRRGSLWTSGGGGMIMSAKQMEVERLEKDHARNEARFRFEVTQLVFWFGSAVSGLWFWFWVIFQVPRWAIIPSLLTMILQVVVSSTMTVRCLIDSGEAQKAWERSKRLLEAERREL